MSLIIKGHFYLEFDICSNNYKYDRYSLLIENVFQGNEDELFKRIFVKIEDCPKWSREDLYRIRKNQLKNFFYKYCNYIAIKTDERDKILLYKSYFYKPRK